MPHVAGGVEGEQDNISVKVEKSSPTKDKAKKKKKPRIRIRSRNKCFKDVPRSQSVNPATPFNSPQTQENFANNTTMNPTTSDVSVGAQCKTHEQILAEPVVKNDPLKAMVVPCPLNVSASAASTAAIPADVGTMAQKTREQIMSEREAKKLAKQAVKAAKTGKASISCGEHGKAYEFDESTAVKLGNAAKPHSQETQYENKKRTLTKVERRAIQEAQRAAKAQSLPRKQKMISTATKVLAPDAVSAATIKLAEKNRVNNTVTTAASMITTISLTNRRVIDCKVRLFNHLLGTPQDIDLFVINNSLLHPAIARLGVQYAQRTVVGSNARCIAFLNVLKTVIQDFETPLKKAFTRSLETSINHCVEHLQRCRPLAVSVVNAHKHIKHVLTQLPGDQPESESKEHLCHFIDTYIENQIGKAAQAISSSMQDKISNGDVILTFGCSSLISYICEEAHQRHVTFRVIVVDSRPFCDGQESLRRLTTRGIPCTYILINAVSFVMPEVTRVVLGAHALLANGYVMGRAGTAQVALVAHAHNVPVLVCCETHKFSERYQTDAIVYNELGNPDDLVLSEKCCLSNWQEKAQMSPLNLIYDITPPELVTAVVTEVSILPCSSVPVILRIKPTEIGYYC